MIVFRCSRCSKVNISIEGHRCLHCGNEESRVSSIPENQTEVRSTSTNDNDVFLHMQNKSTGTDLSVLSQASEKLSAAKLHASDEREKDTKTLNANRSHIFSSQGKPKRPIARKSVFKEMVISPGQSVCGNTFYSMGKGTPIIQNSILKEIRISRDQAISTKSGAGVPTKTLQHISEDSYSHMSKNNLTKKKTFEHKTTMSIQNENTSRKLNLGSSWHFSKEKSKMDSFTKDFINVNQLKDETNYSSGKLLRKTDTPTINNSFQDDMKITNAFPEHSAGSSQEAYLEGCSKNDLNAKMSIKSIQIPVLQKLYLCNKCGEKFNNESAFNVHFKCELCDLVCTSNCHLNQHHKKHILAIAMDASTAQQKADQSFQQREQETSGDGNTQKNFETSTIEKIFLCTECGFEFICESDFNAHSLENREQNAFNCNKCHKQFHYEFYLNMHYRMHTLGIPFTCKICGFSSTQRSNLRKHLKTHD